jgi:RNA polymerase sigma-70 factor, ECF subfamily
MVSEELCLAKTDEELVGLTLTDQDYFYCLMKRYEGRLLSYIMKLTNANKEEAEDILQDTFIKVYRNLNDFDLSLKFSSWIYRITHNEVISAYRKVKARPEYISYDADEKIIRTLANGLDLNAEVDNKYLKNAIEKILSGLDVKYREVIILKFIEGYDYKEISDILAKPMGTIATLIKRAKEKFKEEIKRQNIKI